MTNDLGCCGNTCYYRMLVVDTCLVDLYPSNQEVQIHSLDVERVYGPTGQVHRNREVKTWFVDVFG